MMTRWYIFFLLANTVLLAQDGQVSSHDIVVSLKLTSVIDIEGDKDVTIDFDCPSCSEAGKKLKTPPLKTGFNTWLNYSAVRSTPTSTHNVKVSVDRLIPGIKLYVQLLARKGVGQGDLGTAVTGRRLLSTTSQTVIRNIGTGYTGNGVGNGHQLIYTAKGITPEYDKIEHATHQLVISYTIVEN